MPRAMLDAAQLYYLSSGSEAESGTTLVLVHGAGGSLTLWGAMVAHLRTAPLTTVRIDLPGHGHSPAPGADSIDAYAQLLAEFIEHLGARNVVVGGHSMGGGIAMQLALAHPFWLKGLVVVSSGARLRVQPQVLDSLRRHECAALDFMGQVGFGQGVEQQVIDTAVRELQSCQPEVVCADFEACDRFDIVNRLAEIAAPTLVCCGEADLLTPLKYSRFLAERLSEAELLTWSEAGHMLPLERPAELSQAVLRFAQAVGQR